MRANQASSMLRILPTINGSKAYYGSEMGSVVEAHALLCGPTQVLRRQTFLCELLYYELHRIKVYRNV